MSALKLEFWKELAKQCHNASAKLMAVSKGQSIDTIEALLSEGQRLFGENKIQEAEKKWLTLKEKYPTCQLHFIGSLQTNKVKQALKLFDCIQSVDRLSLAEALHKEMQTNGRMIPLMIQLNLGNEPQKGGVPLDQAEDFIKTCMHHLNLPIVGLMGIPPQGSDPIPYFKYLITMANQYDLKEKSMGMSSDYQQALNCGSTMIRLGSALFGSRS